VSLKQGKFGRTLLHFAAKGGCLEVVKLLLEDPRVDVRAVDEEGGSVLHHAAFEGHVEVVKLLLGDPRVDVRAVDKNGCSALQHAASKGHVEVVKLLLWDPRVDVRALSKEGCSALHYAAFEGHGEVVKLLLGDPRVEVRAVDEEGWSALHYAASGGHVEVVKLLMGDPRVDARAISKKGFSAMHYAAAEGHVEVVKLLLENRVDAHAKTNSGNTPLHLASAENHYKVVRLLLDNPRLSTANCADNIHQCSPVMTALKTKSKDALQELLNHPKVSLSTIDGKGRSLEMVARSTGCPDLLDMVKRALDHRREERTEEVQEEGIRTKAVEDDDGPGQGENNMEARDAEGDRRSKTTDTVDGAAALDPALVGENSCWNCGTPGKEGNLCTCRGCRKALYCNDKCQVEDWEKHRRFCRKKAKKRQRRKEARQRGGEVNEGGDDGGGLEDFDGLNINEVD